MHKLQYAQFIYLWGGEGSGKSHLSYATCDSDSILIPLKTLQSIDAERGVDAIKGLESYQLIVLDDIDVVVGDRIWEEELFHLFNRVKDGGKRLLITASSPLSELQIVLPDLQSRLSEAVVEKLVALSDRDKWAVVQQRAAARGMKIGDEVVEFLINRTARDFHTLFTLLEKLDEQTLIAQRKITIPFVKKLLGF
jgi:DnaA family protein